MDPAVGRERVVESDPVAYPLAIDEDHDVRPQMALLIENIAAQSRIGGKRGVECVAQHQGRRVDLRHLGEASQLLSEN